MQFLSWMIRTGCDVQNPTMVVLWHVAAGLVIATTCTMSMDISAGYTHLEAMSNVWSAPLAVTAKNVGFCYVGSRLFGTVLDFICFRLGL